MLQINRRPKNMFNFKKFKIFHPLSVGCIYGLVFQESVMERERGEGKSMVEKPYNHDLKPSGQGHH